FKDWLGLIVARPVWHGRSMRIPHFLVVRNVSQMAQQIIIEWLGLFDIEDKLGSTKRQSLGNLHRVIAHSPRNHLVGNLVALRIQHIYIDLWFVLHYLPVDLPKLSQMFCIMLLTGLSQ